MRIAILSTLAALSLTACASDPGEPAAGLDVYRQPCDLSQIAAIDIQPSGMHVVVRDADHMYSGDIDVTSYLKPLMCLPFDETDVLAAVTANDWYTVLDGQVAFRAQEVGEGDDRRLTFEMRELPVKSAPDKFYIAEGELLARTRATTSMGSLLIPFHGDMELGKTRDQIAAENNLTFVEQTFSYTYR